MFFIEAKKTKLTLKDLGQLWAYCKLVDPDEAFLLSSADLGSLRKLVAGFKREGKLDGLPYAAKEKRQRKSLTRLPLCVRLFLPTARQAEKLPSFPWETVL